MKVDIALYQEKYREYIQGLNLPDDFKKQVIELLENKNLEKRKEIWDGINITLRELPNIHKIANPYFLGYGNPDSDILFIGKELGFDIGNHPHLLLHESVNNLLHWKKIIEKEDLIYGQDENGKDKVFDPTFPSPFFPKKTSGHTWRLYSKVIAGYLGEDLKTKGNTMFKEMKDRNNSFFKYCFLTEYHFLPISKNQNKSNSGRRIDFLENENFFKKFKVILITAKKYVSREVIEDWFDCKREEAKDLFVKKENTKVEVFRNAEQGQMILRLAQLSGSAGWSHEKLQKIGEMIQKHLKEVPVQV